MLKVGAVVFVRNLFNGAQGSPQIILDKVVNAPTGVPVKFTSPITVQTVNEQYRDRKFFYGC